MQFPKAARSGVLLVYATSVLLISGCAMSDAEIARLNTESDSITALVPPQDGLDAPERRVAETPDSSSGVPPTQADLPVRTVSTERSSPAAGVHSPASSGGGSGPAGAEANAATPVEPVQPTAATPRTRYRAGEDPEFAARMGWPVKGPEALPGALLPGNRVVCYYGNPNSTRMGALGEFPKDEMLARLRKQIEAWRAADPETPVRPCLHMVSVVAQGEPGTTGKYRTIMRDTTVQTVYNWAREIEGIFIVDIQVGTDDIRNILPRFEWILKHPDVHLAVDPEFYMKGGQKPGTKIGTMDAADVNYITGYLARLVREHGLPPKMYVHHRFTRGMTTNYQQIQLRPEVQIVMHMDGWGAEWLKRDSYRDYIVREPVQYTGFKLFYHNDTKKGDPLMQPEDVLRLEPRPLYIQYQ